MPLSLRIPDWILLTGTGGADVTVLPGAGAVVVAGFAPSVAAAVATAPGVGTVTIAGLAPTVGAAVSASPGAGAIVLDGLAPVVTVGSGVVATPGAGTVAIAGLAPSVAVLVEVLPGAGAIAVAGLAPSVSAGVTVSPGAGTLSVAGLVPVVAATASEIPVRTAIIDAIVAALEDAAITIRGDAVTIERARTDMIEEAERPLLAVVGGDMEALPAMASQLAQRYSLRVILAGYLAAPSEALAESDAAELHAYCIRALIRPDPTAGPVPIMLSDAATEVWIEEGALRIEPASVVQSETPSATCVIELRADVHRPWGNPFITA